MQCRDRCVETGLALLQIASFEGDFEDEKDEEAAIDAVARPLETCRTFRACYLESEYGHWKYATIAYAAAHGHLDCLKQLVAAGCAWHADVAAVAAEAGHRDCALYLTEAERKLRETCFQKTN